MPFAKLHKVFDSVMTGLQEGFPNSFIQGMSYRNSVLGTTIWKRDYCTRQSICKGFFYYLITVMISFFSGYIFDRKNIVQGECHTPF